MNVKRFLITWAVVFVVGTVLGFAIHGTILQDDYKTMAHILRSEEEMADYMIYHFIAGLLFSFAFVFIYTKGVEQKPWLAQGFRYGALVALLWVPVFFLTEYAIYPYTADIVVKQILLETANTVIQGLVTAALYKP